MLNMVATAAVARAATTTHIR